MPGPSQLQIALIANPLDSLAPTQHSTHPAPRTQHSGPTDPAPSTQHSGTQALSTLDHHHSGLSHKWFSSDLSCATCHDGETIPPPTSNLFSFNSPLGACPECRGFGRTIGVDPDLVIPDPRLSLSQGAVKPWSIDRAEYFDLMDFCRREGISTNVPFEQLERRCKAENHRRFGRVLRRQGFLRMAGEQDLPDARAGLPFPLPRLHSLQSLRRAPATSPRHSSTGFVG